MFIAHLLPILCAFPSTQATAPPEELRIPAHSAYHDASTSAGEQLAIWFGRLAAPGSLTCSVELEFQVEMKRSLRLTLGDQTRDVEINARPGAQSVDFGQFEIGAAGYQRFELSLASEPKDTALPKPLQLILAGPPTVGAHFNTKSRRNAASVHLAYPLEESDVQAFYCELTAEEDPHWSYYMATGWHRGYFGMQVNSGTERRIIFSVWDSGQEAIDREKVADVDRVQLVARGADVITGSFGNEGTGGHSHLVFDWKTGEKQRFLVTAKADDETHTTFAGYYFRPDLKQWMLISSWRAPKEGKLLRGLYSFSENFSGRNGHLLRRARYGNQWVQTREGTWRELTGATFSHDATGKADRFDRYMGLVEGEFFLSHGGFVKGEGTFGELFERPLTRDKPKLGQLPGGVGLGD